MQPLWTPSELSAKVSIPEHTLAQWRYMGKGPAWIRVGRHVRYRPEDVETWLAEQTGKARASVG